MNHGPSIHAPSSSLNKAVEIASGAVLENARMVVLGDVNTHYKQHRSTNLGLYNYHETIEVSENVIIPAD